MNKRKMLILSVTGVAAMGILAALIVPGQIRKNRPPEVKTATAAIGDVEQWLSATGTVRSGRVETYAPSAGVSIKETLVGVGDRVKAGQQLATLDASSMETAVKQAESTYAAAQSNLEQMKRAKADADRQLEALDQEIAALESEIAALQQDSDRSSAAMQEAYDRLLAQAQQGTGSPDELAALMEAMSRTSGDLSAKQVELIGKQLQKSVLQSQTSSLSDASIAQMESQVELACSSYESSKETLEKLQKGLVAAFDGIVSEVGSSASLMSSAGITVKDDGDVYAQITLGKYDIPRVKAGQTATISVPGAEFTGEVESVSPIAQTSTSLTGGTTSAVTARIRIDDPSDALRIDFECDVDILIGAAEKAVLVPVESVRTDGDESYCYVVTDGKLRRTAVETGVSSELYVQILSGLSEGVAVAANPSADTTDGMAVRAKAE